MKIRFMLLMLTLVVTASAAAAQNTVKLFDAVAIDAGAQFGPFASTQVYLSCPLGGPTNSILSGPDGGQMIVDNVITVNGSTVCGRLRNCFSYTLLDPMKMVGEPVETSYAGVNPINVSRMITGSGLYTFELYDFGYTFGSTDIYLSSSCGIVTENDKVPVCHRNMGRPGTKTLSVGPAALAAHIGHGDAEGPCVGEEEK